MGQLINPAPDALMAFIYSTVLELAYIVITDANSALVQAIRNAAPVKMDTSSSIIPAQIVAARLSRPMLLNVVRDRG